MFIYLNCADIVLNPVRASIVYTPDEWLWSIWHCMLGEKESPNWLATDPLLVLFAKKRTGVIINTYRLRGYTTMKVVGGYFNIHYTLVSRIVAARKK